MSVSDIFLHPQIILLVVVFCCPLIPAGGWCWLRCIEGVLMCLGAIVAKMRTLAYLPMYLSLIGLLAAGVAMTNIDYSQSNMGGARTWAKDQEFYLFLLIAVLSGMSIFICVLSTVKHIRETLKIQAQRERTVYIIALPAFYGLMCFCAAQQVLELRFDTVNDHWNWESQFTTYREKEQFTIDMCGFYFAAANVFEAFALTFFGGLTMESLKRAREMNPQGEETREMRLQKCMQGWVLLPLFIFCAVLFIEASYDLGTVLLKYFSLANLIPPVIVNSLDEMPDYTIELINGTLFVARNIFSGLALMALFSIDHYFHDELALVGFTGNGERCRFLQNLKFWGVKIFVSLEFALNVGFLPWKADIVLKKLTYSACMATLCLFVSVMHCKAYAPTGIWIEEREDELGRPLILDRGEDAHAAPFRPDASPREMRQSPDSFLNAPNRRSTSSSARSIELNTQAPASPVASTSSKQEPYPEPLVDVELNLADAQEKLG